MDDKKPSNPKDAAATDRIDLSLFPDTAVFYGALAMTEGDLKYGGYNFREVGVSASVYVAAVRRHLAKWWNGSDVDPKTQVHHLASALAGLAVLIDAIEAGKLNDNRPPKVNMEYLSEVMRGRVSYLQQLYPEPVNRFTQKNHD